MAFVEIYTTLTCGSCIRAKRLFASKGIDVTDIDVSHDRGEMVERSGGRHTVPQIFIDHVGIGGFEELVALDRSGGLDPLLGLT